jgi:micrococcal nuclease
LRSDLKKSSSPWWRLSIFSLILLALSLGLLPTCGAAPQGPPQEAVVSRVIDGDTLVLSGGARVRLLGMDAPELEKEGKPADFLAHKSKAVLTNLTLHQKIRLEYDRVRYDRYGRLLAYLFTPDGTFVAAALVRQGLARVYFHNPNFRYREVLLAAQREALEANRGVWPQLLEQDEAYYLGNKNSLRLHRPGCPLAAKIAPANRIRFTNLKEPYLQGYSPCRSCKP